MVIAKPAEDRVSGIQGVLGDNKCMLVRTGVLGWFSRERVDGELWRMEY